MDRISLTGQQRAAVATIVDWYRNRSAHQQVARVWGYAGVGKSTILRYVIEELGLDPMARDGDTGGGVLFAAFTGKAALVMTRKGTPASTIHSLIYRVSEATPEEIVRVETELSDLRRTLPRMGPAERAFAETQKRRLELRLADIHKPTFLLNEQSRVRDAALVVLDEVSMVGREMAADLLAFGKPILVLGDPGQLPPIKDTGAFTTAEPDVMQTEVHRQAGESAIIRLATMARQGEPIGFGRYDDHVWKMRKLAVTPEQALRGGQVICGMNATRLQLNNAMRRAAGFGAGGWLPTGPGEKIICLKNQNDVGLINGMFLTLSDIVDEGSHYLSAVVMDEDGNRIGAPQADGSRGRLRIYKGHFEDHIAFDKGRHDRDWKLKKGLTEATFGWAITGHKSQGSQWENVVVWDDGLGRTELDRRRWLYTVITRAEQGLVILG